MDAQRTGWALLDQLGGNVGQVANAWLTAELIKITKPTSTPAVTTVPNASPGPAANTTTAGLTDPNTLQRYALWAAIGVGVLVVGLLAAKALRR
jgi:hypothetical protein